MESLRPSHSRERYGSVVSPDEVNNKGKRARVILMCGVAFFVVVAVGVFVVGSMRANHRTPFGKPASATPVNAWDTPSASRFAAKTCDEQQKLVPPDSCVVCLSASVTPQTTPSRCLAGTYWDEEETCSCIPCEKNSCCLAGDVMNRCPIGSFQPARGGKTCEILAVGGITNGFEYAAIVKSVLNTEANTPQKFVQTVESPVLCSAQRARKSIAVISGMNLNGEDAKISLKVSVDGESGAKTDVAVSKSGRSRINGAAFGVFATCTAADSVVTMGTLRASNVQKGSTRKRTLMTNLACIDSTPRVFAGLNEIETVGLNQGVSLSITASVRSNRKGLVRPHVEFSSTSQPSAIVAGAAVVAYCSSPDALFGEGYIESGIVDGSGFGSTAQKDEANLYMSKKVVFAVEMRCKQPQVTLALTELEVSGGIAVNLELMSQTSKSFVMRFVAMGNTKISSIKAAYLATCRRDTAAVANAVKKTCGSTLATVRPFAVGVAGRTFGSKSVLMTMINGRSESEVITFPANLQCGGNAPKTAVAFDRVEVGNHNIRLKASVNSANSDSMTVAIATWHATKVNMAYVSYFATCSNLFRTGRAGRGFFNANSAGDVQSTLSAPLPCITPSVWFGMSYIDSSRKANTRLNFTLASATSKALNFGLRTWSSSEIYSASVQYVAWCPVGELSPSKIQTGRVAFIGGPEHKLWIEHGVRTVDLKGVFSTTMICVPKITFGISLFDSWYGDWARLDNTIIAASKTGFTVRIRVWENSGLWRMAYQYLAVC